MKKEVVLFGEGGLLLSLQNDNSILIQQVVSEHVKANIGKFPSDIVLNEDKALVLRFKNIQGLNVLKHYVDYLYDKCKLKE